MTPLTQVLEATLQKWRTEGAHFRPGASPEKVAFFERNYQVALPTELREYFTAADGMGGTKFWEEDGDMISFWPLPEAQDIQLSRDTITHVAPLPTVWGSAAEAYRDLFVIGDWCILSFAFCARLSAHSSETAEIFHYEGGEPMLIARSFREFLHRYVQQGFEGIFPG